MLWDFRLLVKPLVLMQSHHEIFTFRFNRTDPNLVVGGCITGQVIVWDLSAIETRIGTHGGSHGAGAGASGKKPDAARMPDEEEDKT
jgi:hypothetical protein